MTDALPRLTVICPVFNEAEAIPLFFNRLEPVARQLSGQYEVRLVFLNNASTDGSLKAIRELRRSARWVHVISLSANVGYQRSVEAGLRNVSSDSYAIIDVDCEDPPEMIATFVALYEEGFDIVYGERVDRVEPRLLKKARHLFYRVMRAIADDDILLDMAEFSLLSRDVRDAIIEDETSFPFIRASIGRVGFRRRAVPYKREARIAGRTHYNVFRMTTFAVAGILSASTWLLRMAIYLLPFWLIGVAALCVAAVTGVQWATPVMLLVMAVYLGCTMAVIAIYVARIYKNTLGRPNAFVDRRATNIDHELLAQPRLVADEIDVRA